MSDHFIEIEYVAFQRRHETGRSFWVRTGHGGPKDGKDLNVPNFAVHKDSRIHQNCPPGRVDTLVMRADIAMRNGLVEDEKEGSGLLFKKPPRSRLSPPTGVLSKGQLKKIAVRAARMPKVDLDVSGSLLDHETREDLGIITDPRIERFLNVGPEDIERLLADLKIYRAFVKRVCGG